MVAGGEAELGSIVVDRMPYGKHLSVEDSHDNDTSRFGAVEDDVALMFDPAKGRIEFDAGSASKWTLGQ